MFQGTELNFSEIPARREQTTPGPNVVAAGGDITALGVRVTALESAPPPSAAWGDITGTLADQTDLQTALDGKQPSGSYAAASHTHSSAAITDFTEAAQDVVGAMVAAAGGSYDDGAGTITLPGGSVLSGLATVTVPNSRIEWEQTVAATGVTGASRILADLAPALDSDENSPDFLPPMTLAGAPGAGTITFSMAFAEPVAGPIKLNWSAL